MSKETAAATLTRIYFESVPSERNQLPGRSSDEPWAVAALDSIGLIYGIFLAKMDTFRGWGEERIRSQS